jgi:hypothetical protein
MVERIVTALQCDRMGCESVSVLSESDVKVRLPRGWSTIGVGNDASRVDRFFCSWDCLIVYGRRERTLMRREQRKTEQDTAQQAPQDEKGL